MHALGLSLTKWPLDLLDKIVIGAGHLLALDKAAIGAGLHKMETVAGLFKPAADNPYIKTSGDLPWLEQG